jgi:xanthine/uracil permease
MKTLLTLLFSAFILSPAMAHPDHGDTPLHAVLHMFEENGLWIGLLFVIVIASLIRRAKQNQTVVSRTKQEQGPGHDSR